MNDLHKIPVLTVRFQNELAQGEIPLFRGAVISKVPPTLTLFHNHEGDSLRYRYPLIQYKRIGGKAAILCLGEGTEAIGNFFAGADFSLRIGQRTERFAVENIQATQWLLQTWESDFCYTLRKWLPFNTANYAAYKQLESVAERAELLEHILTGNILSMCTGLGKHLDSPVSCRLMNITAQHTYIFKGVKMQGLDIEFRTNVYIPDYLGIGKGVSHGFGVMHKMNNNIKSDNL